MEQAKRVKLSNGTLIEADPNRPYSRFLKITTGPAVIRYTLADAEAIHRMLGDYFSQPEVVEALDACDDVEIPVEDVEPIDLPE